jgi:hypothetical protein
MQPSGSIRSFTFALAALTGGVLVAGPAGAVVLGDKPETACYGV